MIKLEFKDYVLGKYRTIKVTDMKPFVIEHSAPTEEGYHSESHEYSFCGDSVEYVKSSSSRDCDGPLHRTKVFVCKIENLAKKPLIRWNEQEQKYLPVPDAFEPEWEEVSSTQRDEYAEAMGY